MSKCIAKVLIKINFEDCLLVLRILTHRDYWYSLSDDRSVVQVYPSIMNGR